MLLGHLLIHQGIVGGGVPEQNLVRRPGELGPSPEIDDPHAAGNGLDPVSRVHHAVSLHRLRMSRMGYGHGAEYAPVNERDHLASSDNSLSRRVGVGLRHAVCCGGLRYLRLRGGVALLVPVGLRGTAVVGAGGRGCSAHVAEIRIL